MDPEPSRVYDPGLYEKLAEVEDRHFWFQARNRAIVAAFELVKPRLDAGYRVLEVGCGTGNVLRALQAVVPQGRLFGMDYETEGLRYAKVRAPQAGLVVGDAGHPPFDVQFDVIGAFDVIEHVDDDQHVLAQLGRLLKPNGFLLLTVPADPRLWSYFDVAAHHRRRYRFGDLHTKLAATGYHVEYMTPFMTALTPVLWAGRRLTGRRGRAQEVEPAELVQADLRVRPAIGAGLGLMLAPEVRFIRSRWRLPAGTSLLAVASRT